MQGMSHKNECNLFTWVSQPKLINYFKKKLLLNIVSLNSYVLYGYSAY